VNPFDAGAAVFGFPLCAVALEPTRTSASSAIERRGDRQASTWLGVEDEE